MKCGTILIRKWTKNYRKMGGSPHNIITAMGHQWLKGNNKVKCPHRNDGKTPQGSCVTETQEEWV